MLLDFKQFIEQELQLNITDKILLAVSGGADSVLMLYLFWKAGYTCGVAHCNFHLRGSDSDMDEELVTRLAKKYDFTLHKIDFDTNLYASENGISIEMAARELRYTWFDKIKQESNYQYLATAHHKNDLIETFFINLLRGTGIRGLSGFCQKRNGIIRPMLFTDRPSIMDFINEEGLEFREDKSNFDITIIRNRLRHKIIPQFKEINPSCLQNIIQTIENLKDAEILMDKHISDVRDEFIKVEDNYTYLDIRKLKQTNDIHAYLFEFIHEFGFNSSQIVDIENVLDAVSGKIFRSKTHELVKDRDFLVIKSILDEKQPVIYITENDQKIGLKPGMHLNITKAERNQGFLIPREPEMAVVDFDKLKFPLQIRNWQQGDYFHPLGMRNRKKISDFFIDIKCNLAQKKETKVLVSDNQIVWLIGMRIDDRFKITENTSQMLILKLIKHNA